MKPIFLLFFCSCAAPLTAYEQCAVGMPVPYVRAHCGKPPVASEEPTPDKPPTRVVYVRVAPQRPSPVDSMNETQRILSHRPVVCTTSTNYLGGYETRCQ